MIRNVQRLELDVPKFPGNVLTCRSLTSILHYVHLNYVVNVPDSFYLPKLKVLSIMFFGGRAIGLAQKLMSSCPALEDFSMRCLLGLQTTFVISLPLLKRLTMYTRCQSEYTLVIDAPQLQFLEIRTSLHHVPSYVMKNVGSEVEAVIDVGEDKSEVTEKETLCNVQLLNRLTEVKSLTLGSQTMRGLSNVDVPKKLPIFNKLTWLKLNMRPFYGGEIMCHLLQSSPSLEVYIVEMDFPDEPEGEWIEPKNVPLCISSHLRVVEIYCLSPRAVRQELEMMKYLLGNGQVLQKLVVKGRVDDVEFCKELLTFPRASRDCEVQVCELVRRR